MLVIVGDAYARPIVDALRQNTYDLSSLQQLSTGGAMTRPDLKHALLELLPDLMIIDGYGASETGGMAFGASTKGAETQQFQPSAGAVVLAADRTRFLEPGDDEVGWTARVGRVPLGYLDDRERTEQTFPIVDGRRLAVPGDRATLAADGTIVLLGRDSLVVNSGGEKIFVEEVEEAIRRHPDVLDALVVGRPSDRFGEEVVALVQLRDGAALTGADIRDYAVRNGGSLQGAESGAAVRSHRTSSFGQGRLRMGAAGRARRGARDGLRRRGQRGMPRMRSAIRLRWICDVPAAIVYWSDQR